MRHYEITLIVHPDQSSQVTTMIEKYKELITSGGGIVHRQEDWGRKHLAYPINKIYKAHYLMMNIECDQDTLDKLNYNFRFNDAVIRNLIISKSKAITEPSIMFTNNDKDKVEEKAKFKTKDKVEVKVKDKVEEKIEVKVEDKVEEKIEVKVEDKVEEKIEVKVEDTE